MPKKFPRNSSPRRILEGCNNLKGKIFFITGATSGIGKETAKALALSGATVVIASRDSVAAGEFIHDTQREKADVIMEFFEMDLGELMSVQECAESFLTKYGILHCLVLNAGVYNPIHRITDDDFEATFQINYMAQAYLAHLLLPALKKGAPSRVIAVSCEHYSGIGGRLPLGKVTWCHLSPTHKTYFNSAPYAYGLSKLCMILYSNEFNRNNASHGVMSNAVDPGSCVGTNLYYNSRIASLYAKVRHPFRRQAIQGAANVVYCAAHQDLDHEGGHFYKDFKKMTMPRRATNIQVARVLWSRTEFMVKMHFEKLERKAKRKETDRWRWARMTM